MGEEGGFLFLFFYVARVGEEGGRVISVGGASGVASGVNSSNILLCEIPWDSWVDHA